MGNNTEEGYVEIERTRDGAKKIIKIDEALELIKNMSKTKQEIDI